MLLPKDLEDIVFDYAWGCEHQQKFHFVLCELMRHHSFLHFSNVRLEFLGTYYPDFYTDLSINGQFLIEQAAFSDV